MAEGVPVPAVAAVPAVEGAPMGDLFQNYDPTGALNGMFAPAYIQGFKPAQEAVAAWNLANRGMTRSLVDELRMPAEWRDPNAGTFMGAGVGGGPYGAGGIPNNISFGDSRGVVDPEALRVMAQGGKYDAGARRAAIAARILANEQAQNAVPKATDTPIVAPPPDLSGYMKYEYQSD